MKAALKARQSERLSAIRLLMAAAVIAVTERLIKQRRDSIEQFQAAGRTDLVDKETAELELLKQYLPQPLSQEEVASAIEAAIAATGASGPQAMGKVMAALKAQLAGRADMTRVSALVKARLGS